MLPGPIFNVELLTTARRTRYFWIRAAYASILLFALGLVYQEFSRYGMYQRNDIQRIAQFSLAFFSVFAWLQLLVIVMLGPAMVAGTIANERERRTIEYLFASRLSNAEIVLGKLAAKLLHVVYLVLTGVPILALMMLLGGIAPEAILALTVITLSTVLTVCTLSIAVSVWSPKARDAVTRTYLVIFAFLVIPPLLYACLSGLNSSFYHGYIAPINQPFIDANPFAVLTECIVQASGIRSGHTFDTLLAFARNHLIVSFLLAAAATLAVRRTHLKSRAKPAKQRRRLIKLWRPSMGNWPMLWKEVYAEPASSRLGWVGRVALTIIVLGVILPAFFMFFAYFVYPHASKEEYVGYALLMGTLFGCGGLVMVASRAAGSVTSEKERDSWVSLISTPLEAKEIVWAKVVGSVWSIRGLVLLLALLWGLAVVIDPKFLVVVPFLLGTFLVLAFYVAALGVRYSLWCRNSLRAMAATVGTAALFGGFYFFCFVPVFMAVSPPGHEALVLVVAPVIPFLLAFPGYMYTSGEHFFDNREATLSLFAYIGGIVGYSITAVVLVGSSIGRFDSLSGRTVPDRSPRRPPKSPFAPAPELPAPVAAVIVPE